MNLHKKFVSFYKDRKLLVLSIALVIVLFVGANGTMAWLSARDNIVNRFTASDSNFDIRVVDIFEQPKKPPNAGVAIAKVVGAQNLGKTPGVVRLLVLPTLVNPNAPVIFAATIGTNASDTVIIEDLDTVNWQYCAADGYWYYKGVLQPGERAPNLFTKVHMASGLDSMYEETNLKIEVKCEASGVGNYRTSWWNTTDDSTLPVDVDQILIDTALQTALS